MDLGDDDDEEQVPRPRARRAPARANAGMAQAPAPAPTPAPKAPKGPPRPRRPPSTNIVYKAERLWFGASCTHTASGVSGGQWAEPQCGVSAVVLLLRRVSMIICGPSVSVVLVLPVLLMRRASVGCVLTSEGSLWSNNICRVSAVFLSCGGAHGLWQHQHCHELCAAIKVVEVAGVVVNDVTAALERFGKVQQGAKT
eukprot:1158453-Pelagomonas_calceolata.AAC.5